MASTFAFLWSPSILAQTDSPTIREIRRMELADQGILHPAGLSFAADANVFQIVAQASSVAGADSGLAIFLLTPMAEVLGSMQIDASSPGAINVAYDDFANRFLVFDSGQNQLIVIGLDQSGAPDSQALTRYDAQPFGIQTPQGMTVDARDGHLYILDESTAQVVHIQPAADGAFANAAISRLDLEPLGITTPRGLAMHPASGHLFTINPNEQELYEFTLAGELVGVRDLTPFALTNPQGLVFAPSGDLTDDPTQMNLYIADGGAPRTAPSGQAAPNPALNKQLYLPLITGELGAVSSFAAQTASPADALAGTVIEFSFAEPAAPTTSAIGEGLVQAANVILATPVRTIFTSQFSPPSPDPAGIVFLNASNSFLIGDSEVNEMPALFTGDNLFEMAVTGNLVDTFTTMAFSDEPTGLDINPANGHLFVSDDDAREVFEVNPGPDAKYGTGDDIVTSFDTAAFNSFDPEGITYDSTQNVLFVVDGLNSEVYRIAPGNDGIFNGVAPAGDDQVTSFDTSILGITDGEGIVYNPATNNLFLSGNPAIHVAEVTTTGELLRTIDISEMDPREPAGLALGPSSQNASDTNLYIVERRVDNNTDPNENDGRIYEVAFPPLSPSNTPPIVNAGLDQTVTLPNSASLHGAVADDGQPTPPGAVAITWSRVSGPGAAVFSNPNALDTQVTFNVPGSYVLRLTADDSELFSEDDVNIIVNGSTGVEAFEARVAASSDDAEEQPSGSLNLTSADLDMLLDQGSGNTNQYVGLRFTGVAIPQGAAITNAFVQFQADETSSTAAAIIIQGQAADNPVTFGFGSSKIAPRPRTAAAVTWSPAPWTINGEAGVDQRTSDIAPVVQEIVNRPGWASGNAMVIIISGTGNRAVESFNGSAAGAPLLHIEYATAGPVNQPPIANAGPDQTVADSDSSGAENITLNGAGSSDPDGTIVSYQWSSNTGVIIPDGVSPVASFPVGVHTVTLTVTDNAGVQSSDLVVITITAPPTIGTVFFDNFESNLGWTVNPNGADTATTGRWERGDPEPVDSSGPKQLGTTVSGNNDLVTGRLAGSSAGANDIDNGVTSIRSPNINLPAGANLTLSFSYYLAHATNSSSADFLRVRIIGASTQTVFQELGAANNDDAVWASFSGNISAFAGQTVYLLIEAADAGTASLVEAAVDDVRIEATQ
ncbi:MAG: PKD domain-containing protein [Caldilineaceae bacterium]